jgi:hypothetical protein
MRLAGRKTVAQDSRWTGKTSMNLHGPLQRRGGDSLQPSLCMAGCSAFLCVNEERCSREDFDFNLLTGLHNS